MCVGLSARNLQVAQGGAKSLSSLTDTQSEGWEAITCSCFQAAMLGSQRLLHHGSHSGSLDPLLFVIATNS